MGPVGPVRYLATLLGAKDDDALRYFILVVALLDPAAVLLLLAATRTWHVVNCPRRRRKVVCKRAVERADPSARVSTENARAGLLTSPGRELRPSSAHVML